MPYILHPHLIPELLELSFRICRFKQRVGDWDLMKTGNFRVWLSTRPIVNMYFIAFILSLIIMVFWVAVVGGVHKRSDAT
jgi:hypothetical protein